MTSITSILPILFILVVYFIQNSSSLSSLVYIYQKHQKIKGPLIKSLQIQSNILCAHRCLAIPICSWYNYKQTEPGLQQGTCELVGSLSMKKDEFTLIDRMEGWTCGKMMSYDRTFIFSNLGAKGRIGPVTTTKYDGTSLQGQVTLVKGIQHWTVPQTGNYVLEAWGASGGNGTNSTLPRVWRRGGLGARIKGVFFLNRGQSLKILVGQEGQPIMDFNPNPGSGGGGSFVTFPDNTPLVVAGGGGGGSSPADGWLDGQDGQATSNGSSFGGVDGSGGRLKKDYSNPVINCGAGGGLKTAGESTFLSGGGDSFINGGKGGLNQPSSKGNGGFGGGGASNSEPGGGGGYSGGSVVKGVSSLVAGGGGSYNGGELKENKAGVNKGHGKVVITILTD